MLEKNWWKSKTIWLSILLIAGGIAEFLVGIPEVAAGATIAAGILNVIIRVLSAPAPISGTPPSRKASRR